MMLFALLAGALSRAEGRRTHGQALVPVGPPVSVISHVFTQEGIGEVSNPVMVVARGVA